MKKLLLIPLSVLMLAGLAIDYGMAQTPAPNISVALALEKSVYYPNEPIKIVMTLANRSEDHIITSQSFIDQDFHVLLRFTGEDGKEISSNQLKDSRDPSPPKVIPVGGELLQVELVDVLAGPPAPWVLSLIIADARTYYPLIKGGQYSVRAVIPMRTYPAYETVSGKKYARIDSSDWSGALESLPGSFTLVADADHDGYCYPLPCLGGSKVDCDDNDASVNPGMTEIPNNGKDDDCNPATPDVVVLLNPGDLNGDGKVDCADLAIVKASLGKKCGQTGFDSRADINKDCVVDVRDLAAVSQRVPAGTRCP